MAKQRVLLTRKVGGTALLVATLAAPAAMAQTRTGGPRTIESQTRAVTTAAGDPTASSTSFLASTATPRPLALTENDIRITTNFAAAYDDNIFRTPQSRGDKADELILSSSAALAVERILGSIQVAANVLYGTDVFTFHPDRSRPRLAASGRATATIFGSCGLTPYGDYRRERSDFGDLNAPVDNTGRQTRFGLLAQCQRPAGFFPSVAIERYTTRNDLTFNYADQSTNTVVAGIGYRRPSLGQAVAYYRRDSVDRPTLGSSNVTDRFGLSFDRAISSLFAASVDVHWLSVRSTDPQVSDYRGPGWRVQVYSRALEPIRLEASTSRTVVNDTILTDDFVIQSSYGLGAQIPFSELSSARLGVDYRTRDFRANPVRVRGGLSDDTLLQFRAGLTRRLTPRVALQLDATHTRRATTPDTSSFDANRVTLGGQIRF